MGWKAVLSGLLWSLRSNLSSLPGLFAKALATGLSYFGGIWVVLFVGVVLFGTDAITKLLTRKPAEPEPARREDEGR